MENGRFKQKFKELSIIGTGIFGVVWVALSKDDNMEYAIKKIPISDINVEHVERLLAMMAKLRDDHIVNYISAWREKNFEDRKELYRQSNIPENHPFFCPENNIFLHIQMELCFKTLKDIIHMLNEDLSDQRSNIMTTIGYFISSELLAEILEGVYYLHRQRPPIIHRNLKPTNILISESKNGKFVKIAGFGLAKIQQSISQINTEYVGSPKYMAPEVVSGNYNTPADIYSLGVIIQDLFNIDINEYVYNWLREFKFHF
jgi:serine/threonine protein kinase